MRSSEVPLCLMSLVNFWQLWDKNACQIVRPLFTGNILLVTNLLYTIVQQAVTIIHHLIIMTSLPDHSYQNISCYKPQPHHTDSQHTDQKQPLLPKSPDLIPPDPSNPWLSQCIVWSGHLGTSSFFQKSWKIREWGCTVEICHGIRAFLTCYNRPCNWWNSFCCNKGAWKPC